MKTITSLAIAGVVLLSAGIATPASAATHAPAKMTCAEFVALDNVVRPKIVYWTEGFNHKGEPTDAVVDVERADSLVPVLIEECRTTPNMSFWQKMKQHF